MAIDFGTDLSCVTGITPEGRTVSDPKILIAEAVVRRLTTPRGMVLDDPDYGTDLREFLNDDVDQLELVRIRSETRSELLKDERIVDVTILESTYLSSSRTLTMRLGITVNELEIRLVLSIDNVTASILSVE